jgi:hypothetical protein
VASPCAFDRILKPVKDSGNPVSSSLTGRPGADASGQFCQTLAGTGAGSGWTGERTLPGSDRSRIKERTQQIRNELPFPLPVIDSGNGGGFTNRPLKDWRGLNHIQFARGRPYRKMAIASRSGKTVMRRVKPWGMAGLRGRKCTTHRKRSAGV